MTTTKGVGPHSLCPSSLQGQISPLKNTHTYNLGIEWDSLGTTSLSPHCSETISSTHKTRPHLKAGPHCMHRGLTLEQGGSIHTPIHPPTHTSTYPSIHPVRPHRVGGKGSWGSIWGSQRWLRGLMGGWETEEEMVQSRQWTPESLVRRERGGLPVGGPGSAWWKGFNRGSPRTLEATGHPMSQQRSLTGMP